jgi:hypothetical protein
MLWFNFILPIVKDPDCNVKRQMDQGKEWTNRKTDGQVSRQTDREIDCPTSRKTTYNKIDRGADGQTVRRKS